jgi:hypothetical protein
VRRLSEHSARREEQADAFCACVDGGLDVRQHTPTMGDHGRPWAERNDALEVLTRAWRRGRRGQLQVVDPERVDGSRDRELVVQAEVGSGALLTFSQRGIDDPEGMHVPSL